MKRDKIFIIMGGWKYEGETTVGIASTLECAEMCAKKSKKQRCFDYINIEEWEYTQWYGKLAKTHEYYRKG